MSVAKRPGFIALSVAAGVLAVGAVPAFLWELSWQGWLLVVGVSVMAFLVAVILTRGKQT